MDIAANKKLKLLSAGVSTDVVHVQARSDALGLSTGLQICSQAFGILESLEIMRVRLASKIGVREERLKQSIHFIARNAFVRASIWSGPPCCECHESRLPESMTKW